MPANALGSTRFFVTSHFVAPTPYPPSRNDCGTARIASDDVMITIGSTRIGEREPAGDDGLPAGQAALAEHVGDRAADERDVAASVPRNCTKSARPSRP